MKPLCVGLRRTEVRGPLTIALLESILGDAYASSKWTEFGGLSMKFINLCHYVDDLEPVAELRPAHRRVATANEWRKSWSRGGDTPGGTCSSSLGQRA
jgi:hypothetical protein